jgi:hypothetical protein
MTETILKAASAHAAYLRREAYAARRAGRHAVALDLHKEADAIMAAIQREREALEAQA